MTPERWHKIEQLFFAAMEQAPDRQEHFLAAACGTDEDLRMAVAQLLTQSGATHDVPGFTAVNSAAQDLNVGLTVGDRLGPYQIVGLLGEGGMGKVYRAIDTRLGRTVAIKFLWQSSAKDSSARRWQFRLSTIPTFAHFMTSEECPLAPRSW
jgi:hypothetical protein